MEWDKKVSGIVALIGAVVVGLLGGWDMWTKGVVMIMSLDVFTGLLYSLITHKTSSSVGIAGIGKKVTIICMIALAVIVDDIVGQTGIFRNMVLAFYISMEALSVLENAVGIGLPVPASFRERLAQLNDGQKKSEPVIIQTTNQTVIETIDGVLKETNRDIVTTTTQKEE